MILACLVLHSGFILRMLRKLAGLLKRMTKNMASIDVETSHRAIGDRILVPRKTFFHGFLRHGWAELTYIDSERKVFSLASHHYSVSLAIQVYPCLNFQSLACMGRTLQERTIPRDQLHIREITAFTIPGNIFDDPDSKYAVCNIIPQLSRQSDLLVATFRHTYLSAKWNTGSSST